METILVYRGTTVHICDLSILEAEAGGPSLAGPILKLKHKVTSSFYAHEQALFL